MLEEIIAPKEAVANRLAICTACPHYKNKLLGAIPTTRFARCGICGCFLKAKAALKDMDCPIGKWPLAQEL